MAGFVSAASVLVEVTPPVQASATTLGVLTEVTPPVRASSSVLGVLTEVTPPVRASLAAYAVLLEILLPPRVQMPATSDAVFVLDPTRHEPVVTKTLGIVGTNAAGVGLTPGDVLALDANGGFIKATAVSVGGNVDGARVFGVSVDTSVALSPVAACTVPGALVPIRFVIAPPAGSGGQQVYLDTVAGFGTLTKPTLGSGNAVVHLGVLQASDGVTLAPLVVFQPTLISEAA